MLMALPFPAMLQMAVPQLQSPQQQRAFNLELANADYDLKAWRNSSARAAQWDFTLLDRAGGAGGLHEHCRCAALG